MTLVPAGKVPGAGEGGHEHAEHEGHEAGHDHAAGLEWEDLMPEINHNQPNEHDLAAGRQGDGG